MHNAHIRSFELRFFPYLSPSTVSVSCVTVPQIKSIIGGEVMASEKLPLNIIGVYQDAFNRLNSRLEIAKL